MLVPDIFCPTHPGPSAPVRRREGTGKLGGGAGQAPTSRQKSLPSWTISAHSEQGVSVTVWYMPRRKGNQRGSGGGAWRVRRKRRDNRDARVAGAQEACGCGRGVGRVAWEAKGGSEQKESPMPWASVGNGDPEPPLEGAVRSEGVAPSPRGL